MLGPWSCPYLPGACWPSLLAPIAFICRSCSICACCTARAVISTIHQTQSIVSDVSCLTASGIGKAICEQRHVRWDSVVGPRDHFQPYRHALRFDQDAFRSCVRAHVCRKIAVHTCCCSSRWTLAASSWTSSFRAATAAAAQSPSLAKPPGTRKPQPPAILSQAVDLE